MFSSLYHWRRYTRAPQNCYKHALARPDSRRSSMSRLPTALAKKLSMLLCLARLRPPPFLFDEHHYRPNEHKKSSLAKFLLSPCSNLSGMSSRRRFNIRPLSPIVGRAILQHLLTVARRVWVVGWQSVDALGPTFSGLDEFKIEISFLLNYLLK